MVTQFIHSFIHFLVGLVPLLIRGRHSGMNRQLIQQVFTQRMPFQPQPISGKHPHTHSHTHSYTTDNLAYPIHLYRMSLDCGGNRSTRRKPTRRQGEHANSTQKRQLSRGSNQRPSDLLAVRRQHYLLRHCLACISAIRL
mgnify:CR=1 FL=1